MTPDISFPFVAVYIPYPNATPVQVQESITKPLEEDNIVEEEDRSLFMVRTEVRSKNAGSHLGHVFPDGPPPTGLRYCMNSAALDFEKADAADPEKEASE